MTQSDEFWDDEELQVENRVRLDKVGDSFSGVLVALTKVTFGGIMSRAGGPERTVPQLALTSDADDELWILNAGAIELRQLLQKLRPAIGDHLTIRVTGVEKLSGRGPGDKEQKHFSMEVKPTN